MVIFWQRFGDVLASLWGRPWLEIPRRAPEEARKTSRRVLQHRNLEQSKTEGVNGNALERLALKTIGREELKNLGRVSEELTWSFGTPKVQEDVNAERRGARTEMKRNHQRNLNEFPLRHA